VRSSTSRSSSGQPVEDDAAEEVQAQRVIDVLAQLAADGGPPQHAVERVTAGGEEGAADRVGEVAVAGHPGDELRHQRGRPRHRVQRHGVGEQLVHVALERPGVGDRDLPVQEGADGVCDERVLGAPAAVHRGLADARSLGNGVRRDPGDPELGDQVQDGGQRRPSRALLERPSGAALREWLGA
jgi:hypothetical protein